MDVPIIQAFPLTLYRGTPLRHKRKKLGLISAREIVHNNCNRIQEKMDYVIESPSFSYYDWQKIVKIADYLSNINQIYIKKQRQRIYY